MARQTQQDRETPETPEGTEGTDNGATEDVQPSAVVATILGQGHRLQAEKKALFTRIGNNRSMLRAMVTEGAATDEQAAEVAKLYPPKAKAETEAAA